MIKTSSWSAMRIRDIPPRYKSSFGGVRSPLSKQIITEQVYDVAEHLFKDGIDFDEADADWFVVPKYVLPRNWHHIAKTTPLLICFPTEYPSLPPIGCYMRETITQAPNALHFYANAYHEAWKEPLNDGWKWYCVYVPTGSWRPASVKRPRDWIAGDNLWTYLTLIKEALTSSE